MILWVNEKYVVWAHLNEFDLRLYLKNVDLVEKFKISFHKR